MLFTCLSGFILSQFKLSLSLSFCRNRSDWTHILRCARIDNSSVSQRLCWRSSRCFCVVLSVLPFCRRCLCRCVKEFRLHTKPRLVFVSVCVSVCMCLYVCVLAFVYVLIWLFWNACVRLPSCQAALLLSFSLLLFRSPTLLRSLATSVTAATGSLATPSCCAV